jgi:hypothetical protein
MMSYNMRRLGDDDDYVWSLCSSTTSRKATGNSRMLLTLEIHTVQNLQDHP